MKYFLILYVLLFSLAGKAQTATDSVKTAVNLLFIAMKNNDADMLKSAFADSAVLQTIQTSKTGNVRIRNEKIEDFANSIKGAPKGSLDEQIIFDVIKMDGDLASVWTPYKFYFNSKFSHCGVNSFQLVRINNVWKIQYLIDTRRVTGCE
jgi:hypothetical protein